MNPALPNNKLTDKMKGGVKYLFAVRRELMEQLSGKFIFVPGL